jgi:hypothetical protein
MWVQGSGCCYPRFCGLVDVCKFDELGKGVVVEVCGWKKGCWLLVALGERTLTTWKGAKRMGTMNEGMAAATVG